MKCQEVFPEVEAFALGALSEEEMSAIQEHLNSCKACRALVEHYNLTLQSLSLEAASMVVEPLVGHHERFRDRLRQRPQLRPGSATAEDLAETRRAKKSSLRRSLLPRPIPGWRGRLVAVTIGLLSLLVVGLGLGTLGLQSQLGQREIQAQSLATQLNQQQLAQTALAQQNQNLTDLLKSQSLSVTELKQLTAGLEAQRNGLDSQVEALVAERDGMKQQIGQLTEATEKAKLFQQVSLLLTRPGATTRTATSDKVGITVLMSPTEREVALFAHSWPELKEGQEYRVWLYHTTGSLVAASSLKLMALPGQSLAEAIVNVPEPMSNYTSLFVTIEKPGVQTPSGPEIVRDKLA